jgi:hypothetical protein
MSYESEEQGEEMRQKAPPGNHGLKQVNSMDSHTSSADNCMTVSLTQSFMNDNSDNDKVCRIVTTKRRSRTCKLPFDPKEEQTSNESIN